MLKYFVLGDLSDGSNVADAENHRGRVAERQGKLAVRSYLFFELFTNYVSFVYIHTYIHVGL